MKFIKVQAPDYTLQVPDDCFRMAGIDICAQMHTKKNPMILNLPSLKRDLKMNFWLKIFVFDIESNSEENNITIKSSEGEFINGQSEITLSKNGSCVMLVPVGADDWFCFIPSVPSAPEKIDKLLSEAAAKSSELAGAPVVTEKPSTNGATKNVGGRGKTSAPAAK